ncbi:MAG: YesL family protein [Lachnospiraceae bacterium]|nr:YesL family protein [Lachnospiraceae bacterium]
MKNFLNLDSPFMIFLSNLTDVVLLNALCLICCIPIVTIGPSITAMHYVTLKMVREEEGYVVKSFFKAFKENFKQSVIVWMIFLVITLVFFLDYRILNEAGMEENKLFAIVIGAIYLFVCLTVMYIFPLLSRFENTLKQTVKNALFMSILHIFKTILMAVIYIIPFILLPLHYNLILVFLIIGLSGPAYINSFIWKSIFKKYEPEEIKEEEIVSDEEFHIAEE